MHRQQNPPMEQQENLQFAEAIYSQNARKTLEKKETNEVSHLWKKQTKVSMSLRSETCFALSAETTRTESLPSGGLGGAGIQVK